LRTRAIVIAVVAALVLAAGALYVSHHAAARAGDGVLSLPVADNGTFFGLLSGGNDDQLLGVALVQLERNYYKPIDPQTPFHGVSSALKAYLASKHIHATLPAEHATGDPSVDASSLEAEVEYAQSHYGAKAGDEALLEQALSGMMNSVDDPYTVYLSPSEIRQLTETLNGGNFGGVGVYILPLRNHEILVAPIEDLPADRAGLRVPLVLDGVGETKTYGLSADSVQTLIRGAAGTFVTLRGHDIGKPKPEHTYRIRREIIHVPTVHAKIENGIDYIRLSDFGETSADEIHAALLDGKARGAKGYILDLRDNGGGLVDSAVAIVSYFVPRGDVVVSEVDRAGNVAPQYADGATIPGLSPLAILVNKYTASASEITAGALQDYGLATLVGTQTFGKGVVQSIYQMPAGGGALKITIARYVTPKGRDIEHRGIRPDIIVDQNTDPRFIDTAGDKQLIAAKAWIEQLLHSHSRS
jgi:carboxyl-terminal processing protease